MKNLFYFVLGCLVGSYTMYNYLYRYIVSQYVNSESEKDN